MNPTFRRRAGVWVAGLACAVAAGTVLADADTTSHRAADPDARPVMTGEAVYRHYCQACHMPDAQGAVGAGTMPALAENIKLTAAGYPIHVVLNGQGAMPWFNGLLRDEEIAGVVNYIRTHFGNNYPDAASAADVAQMRGPVPVEQ